MWRGKSGIWQRRFYEHHIRDEADMAAHLRYCWWNPMKHGFVTRPEDWPYSSYQFVVSPGSGGGAEQLVGCVFTRTVGTVV